MNNRQHLAISSGESSVLMALAILVNLAHAQQIFQLQQNFTMKRGNLNLKVEAPI